MARLLLVAQMGLLSTALLLLQVMDTMWMALIYATLLGLAMGGSRVMDSTVWAVLTAAIWVRSAGRRWSGRWAGRRWARIRSR